MCLGQLGDILSYHEQHSADSPRGSQLHHSMAYTGTAVFTVKLLQTVLPLEKVRSARSRSVSSYSNRGNKQK